ncbi:MAG: UDP-N-acetylmuramoyl-L-alanine--D-glutamate ligase [Bdellovibrionota bacterium]|nr:MAG: UDP-N-acetylmuramoyl-L-alanine--D-glutamate ligase [Bdellovibrionota bacterium]
MNDLPIHAELERVRAQGAAVLVVGLGISGLETLRFLRGRGIRALGVDKALRDKHAVKQDFAARAKAVEALGAELHFGTDGEDIMPLLRDAALAVLSPGVSLESAVVGVLRRESVPVISELELGIELLGVPCIVVTGSNGKSTTVSLLEHILNSCGEQAWACGNIGTPVISYVERLVHEGAPRWLVVEASSYQLEGCMRLRPKAGLFLNLSENHLERHGSFERYFRAKAKLFAHQEGSDLAVANHDDAKGREVLKAARARVASFGMQDMRSSRLCAYVRSREEVLYRNDQLEQPISLRNLKLIGVHNRANIAAAAATLCSLGMPTESFSQALPAFKPLEHRLEFLARSVGMPLVVNDSKSTTVAASIAAFEAIRDAFPDSPVHLMLGGLAKAGSWDPLMRLIERHAASVRQVVCFGADRSLIANYCRTYRIPHVLAPQVAAAIESSLRSAQAGEIVLFSPGCASFDEFTDFEHRGTVFKSLISEFAVRVPSLHPVTPP